MKLTESKIKQFGDLLSQIGAGIIAAGKLVVEIVEENPDGKRQLAERYPQISMSFLNQLEAVGRGQMHPKLALAANPGYVKLRKLPISEQVRYVEEPLELVVEKDGEFDILLVKASDMTPDQAKQVFADDHVRSQGAQRAYLEDMKQKALTAKRAEPLVEPFRICGKGKVEFRAGVVMDLHELAALVARMTGA